ncbi:MAG: N-acetylglucosamine-6-phosphate deacetylase [Candidatus Bipolaricaulaceae bacterium]
MEPLSIVDGLLIFEDRVQSGHVVISAGKIAEVGPEAKPRGIVLSATGLYVAPGFIDLQVNGGGGHSFEDADVKEIRKIANFHLAHGTTGFLASLVSGPISQLRRALGRLQEAGHPAILGAHLEGPFISGNKRGAHNPDHISAISLERFDALVQGFAGFIKVVTFAPELPGADLLIRRIREMGAVPALGHTAATYAQAKAALDQGVRLVTHLGNAMTPLGQREPGVVGAGLDSDAYVSLICDGVHVHPAFVRLVAKVKGFDRICLITDAISAAGLPNGMYSLGSLPVEVQGGVARLPDGTLAGTTLTMDQAVRNFWRFTGCSLPEAVRCATVNPARLLGIADHKGSLEVGKDADLVVFDADLRVHYTVLGGRIVARRD